VKILVRIKNFLGSSVITKKGAILGKVDDLELDDLTRTPVTLFVELSDQVAKTYIPKSGHLTKSVVPLPFKMVGSIGDTVMLTEDITNINELQNQVKTERSIF
jgi:sporulation protein YlmC with PRC-barrel domain